MSLVRFAEQTELSKVYKQFQRFYVRQGNPKAWPKFNDCQIHKSIDKAAVFYTPETTLFAGTNAEQQNQSSVGRNIGYRIVDCAAYFLALNIPPAEVPDTLRICLAVCHANVHWTGVMATADSFKQAYTELYQTWMKEPEEYRTYPDPTVLHNRAKNIINDRLGVITEPKEFATPEADRAQATVRFFQNGKPLVVEHYDSMNAGYYAQRVQNSMDNIQELIEFKPQPCAQQRGNTCGDHTTINLFCKGMFNLLPVINDRRTMLTSTILRLITDGVEQAERNLQRIEIAFKQILPKKKAPIPSLNIEGDLDLIKNCNKMANHVYDLINALYALAPKKTTALVHLAQGIASQSNSIEDELLQDSMDLAQKAVVEELVELFTGRVGSDSSRMPYAALAIVVANDYCSEIEHQRLLKESKKKKAPQKPAVGDLMTYEAIFTVIKAEISAKIKAFEKSNKSRTQRHPWVLGWAGSRSQVSYQGQDYYVPKTISEIVNLLNRYEKTKFITKSPNKRLHQAKQLFNQISGMLDKKIGTKSNMLSQLIYFFKALVAKVFGYKRSSETLKTYTEMKSILDQKKQAPVR